MMTDFDEINYENCSDEELDNILDSILVLMAASAQLPKRNGDYAILNTTRKQDADAIEKMFKETADGKMKIFNGRTTQVLDTIGVEVDGKEIWLNDPKAFVDVAKRADSFEIYPKLNKTIQIAFVFGKYKEVGNLYDKN